MLLVSSREALIALMCVIIAPSILEVKIKKTMTKPPTTRNQPNDLGLPNIRVESPGWKTRFQIVATASLREHLPQRQTHAQKRMIKCTISFAEQTAMPKSVSISKKYLCRSSISEKILCMENSSPNKHPLSLVSSALERTKGDAPVLILRNDRFA